MVNERNIGLDFIRALAITMVVISHYLGVIHPDSLQSIQAFLGGGGVELFFALSGFLIGRILIKIADFPTWESLKTFMIRRWGRTLPSYYFVFLLLILLVPPKENILWHILHYATMTQNLFINPVDIWYGVSWTLAIEEMFYLIFSVALLASCRVFGKRAFTPIVLLFIVVPVFYRFVMFMQGIIVDAQSAIPNLDCIAWGVGIAILYAHNKEWLSRLWVIFSILGGLLLWFAWGSYLNPYVTPQFWPWTQSLGCAGFACLLVPSLRINQLGKLKKIVQLIASKSFTIYLIHGEMLKGIELVFGRPKDIVTEIFIALGFVLLMSWFCHLISRYIEIPFMKMRPVQK